MGGVLERVLVIEDDDDWIERHQVMLDRSRWSVVSVQSVHEAWSELAERTFRALIVEARSRREGFLYPHIEQLASACPESRLIVVTRCPSFTGLADALLHGAWGYFAKPCDEAQVRAALDGASEPGDIEPEVAAMTLAEAEWEAIHRTLCSARWNVSAAARALGLHRPALVRKLDSPPPWRRQVS